MGNFDLHLIEDLPYLLHRDFTFKGDLLGHGAGNLSVPGYLLELSGNLILLQSSFLPSVLSYSRSNSLNLIEKIS